MIRLIKYAILAVIAVALVTIAMANREPMTLTLLPDEMARILGVNWDISLPVFAMILLTFIAGLVFGFLWEWLREARMRSEARQEHKKLVQLEEEVRKVAPKPEAGDDVLAILDGR